jgi:hypothetical protein
MLRRWRRGLFAPVEWRIVSELAGSTPVFAIWGTSMDLVVDVTGLSQQETKELEQLSNVELIKSSGVFGGEPMMTAVIHDALKQLPAIVTSLAALIVAWQKRDALRSIRLQKKGRGSVTLDIRGLAGDDLKTVLKSRITEFGDDQS